MGRMRLLRLCLVAALALGAFGAASASAFENPTWTVCEEGSGSGLKWEDSACTKESASGKFELHELTSGSETRVLLANAGGTLQKLDIHGNTVVCKKVKFNKEARILGGNPGTASGTLEYGECEVEGHSSCLINGGKELKSEPLAMTVVYTTEAAATEKNPEHSALLSEPVNAKLVFFKGEMTGTGCPKGGVYEVKGETLDTDIKAREHLKEHQLEASPAEDYWVNSGGVAQMKTVTHLDDLGESNSAAVGLLVAAGVIIVVVVVVVWWLS
jgi:hypothetical protein